MKTAIYAKNLEKDVRLALYGMLEYSRVKLFPRHKNISIKLHLREHIVDGETIIDDFEVARCSKIKSQRSPQHKPTF